MIEAAWLSLRLVILDHIYSICERDQEFSPGSLVG